MKLFKLDYLVIFLSAVLVIIILFYFITKDNTIKQQVAQLQQELQQLEERKKQVEQVDIDRLSEDISSILLGTSFSTSTDIEVEGVEIIDKGDRKLVINHQEGYQIEIPKNLILNQSRRASSLSFDNLEIINEWGDPRPWMWTSMWIAVWDEKDPNDQWAFEYFYKLTSTTTKEVITERDSITTTTIVTIPEEIMINAEKFYKVTYYKEIEGKLYTQKIEYMKLRNGKLYYIMFYPKFEDYAKTFKFLEQ